MRDSLLKNAMVSILAGIVLFFLNSFFISIMSTTPILELSAIEGKDNLYFVKIEHPKKYKEYTFSIISKELLNVNSNDSFKLITQKYNDSNKYTIESSNEGYLSHYHFTTGESRLHTISASKMKIKNNLEYKKPILISIQSGLISAILYAIVVFIMNLSIKKAYDSTELKINSLKEQNDIIEKSLDLRTKELNTKGNETESLKEEVNRLHGRISRIFLFNKSVLNDYSKENSYWRNLFKELTIKNKENRIDSELIIKKVQSTLKTYTINMNNEDKYLAMKEVGSMIDDFIKKDEKD